MKYLFFDTETTGLPIHVAWKYKRQPRLIFIKSIDEYSWKKREEYQDEKRNTLFDN
mgnify:CR=1 FL=1